MSAVIALRRSGLSMITVPTEPSISVRMDPIHAACQTLAWLRWLVRVTSQRFAFEFAAQGLLNSRRRRGSHEVIALA